MKIESKHLVGAGCLIVALVPVSMGIVIAFGGSVSDAGVVVLPQILSAISLTCAALGWDIFRSPL